MLGKKRTKAQVQEALGAEAMQEAFLNCVICIGPLHEPKTLPCLHSFCTGCLQNHHAAINSQHEHQVQELPCPICRECVVLPPTGVAGLPNDFKMSKIVEFMKKMIDSKNSPTEDCYACMQLGVVSGVQYFCINCSLSLCTSCWEYHNKQDVFREHQTVKTLVGSGNTACFVHTSQLANYYCVNCSAIGCTTCVLTTHHGNGHNIINVGVVYQKRFKDLLKPTGSRIEKVTESLEHLRVLEEHYKNDISSCKASVEESRARVLSQVQDHYDSLLTDLSVWEENKSRLFESKRNDLQKSLDDLKMLQNYATDYIKGNENVATFLGHQKIIEKMENKISENNPVIPSDFNSTLRYRSGDGDEFPYGNIVEINLCETGNEKTISSSDTCSCQAKRNDFYNNLKDEHVTKLVNAKELYPNHALRELQTWNSTDSTNHYCEAEPNMSVCNGEMVRREKHADLDHQHSNFEDQLVPKVKLPEFNDLADIAEVKLENDEEGNETKTTNETNCKDPRSPKDRFLQGDNTMVSSVFCENVQDTSDGLESQDCTLTLSATNKQGLPIKASEQSKTTVLRSLSDNTLNDCVGYGDISLPTGAARNLSRFHFPARNYSKGFRSQSVGDEPRGEVKLSAKTCNHCKKQYNNNLNNDRPVKKSDTCQSEFSRKKTARSISVNVPAAVRSADKTVQPISRSHSAPHNATEKTCDESTSPIRPIARKSSGFAEMFMGGFILSSGTRFERKQSYEENYVYNKKDKRYRRFNTYESAMGGFSQNQWR